MTQDTLKLKRTPKSVQNPSEQGPLCLDLIEKKLYPWTKKYLEDLVKVMNNSRHFKRTILVTSTPGDIAYKNEERQENQSAVVLIKIFAIVKDLIACIDCFSTSSRVTQEGALQRVTRFYQLLNNHKETISSDPLGRQWVQNLLITASILLTGVLPGLLLLALVSAARGGSMKYWQPRGTTFFNRCDACQPLNLKQQTIDESPQLLQREMAEGDGSNSQQTAGGGSGSDCVETTLH